MKRILSCLLCLTMLAAFAASCGEAPENPSVTQAAVSETASSGAETTEAPAYLPPDSDYEGASFCVASYDYSDSAAVWKASTYCEAYVDEFDGDAINDAIYMRNQKVEEELNVRFTLYPMATLADGGKALNVLILAGDDSVDLGLVNGSCLPTIFGERAANLLDLYDLEGIDFDNSWWDQNSRRELEIYGKLNTITGDVCLWRSFAPIIVFFDKQLVEDYALGDMYGMVRDGQWTLDRLISMSETVAHDLNGDGVMGVEDCYGMAEQLSLVANLLFPCNVRISRKDSEGRSQLTLNSDRTATAIEKIVPFLNNDQVNIIANKYSGKYNNVFFDLHLAMFKENRLLFNLNQLLITLDLRDMDADFGILPDPKFDESQDDYLTDFSLWWSTFVIVPVTNGELRMTGEVLESMGYHAQELMTPAYMDVTVRNKTIRDEESAEMLEMILGSISYDLACFYNWGGVLTMINNLGVNNNSNFASAYAAIETKVQAALDATFDAWDQ